MSPSVWRSDRNHIRALEDITFRRTVALLSSPNSPTYCLRLHSSTVHRFGSRHGDVIISNDDVNATYGRPVRRTLTIRFWTAQSFHCPVPTCRAIMTLVNGGNISRCLRSHKIRVNQYKAAIICTAFRQAHWNRSNYYRETLTSMCETHLLQVIKLDNDMHNYYEIRQRSTPPCRLDIA